MKKILIILDEESSKVLEKFPNMSQTVRTALKVYNEHISTDEKINKKLEEFEAIFERLDRIASELESRM